MYEQGYKRKMKYAEADAYIRTVSVCGHNLAILRQFPYSIHLKSYYRMLPDLLKQIIVFQVHNSML